ncbi:hypothetical protein [Variovorax ginsengisoli]|uniref:Uncharacterized protein n=1 Tax=Variovorax ginsengisoli TaxID=363844 RepID=A0ABT8SDW8_9BURK|nr:hypothetical protein [Variovorax ginsengisoli]MDN8617868.1 hypothetical protein [Variovorax ginsengisoli]MDO1537038.1 hypothetical protein [Variovorax ginsengisoli]
MKRILFTSAWFETDHTGTSHARFEAGKDYPADDAEAKRCVARGIAEEVDVADEPAAAPNVTTDAPATEAAEPAAEAPAAEPAPAPAPATRAKK